MSPSISRHFASRVFKTQGMTGIRVVARNGQLELHTGHLVQTYKRPEELETTLDRWQRESAIIIAPAPSD